MQAMVGVVGAVRVDWMVDDRFTTVGENKIKMIDDAYS